MALEKCAECGKEISSEADACPHCGKKTDKPSGCGIVVLLFVMALVGAAITGSCTSKKSPQDPIADARGACRSAIELTLNDPGSAEFVGLSTEAYAIKQPDGSWIVQRKVRAKNAFGAYRLAVFECKVKPNDDGTWRGLYVKQISP